VGPGPAWGDADRRATQAFQLAQGWNGADADGIPGATTWDYLTTGRGRDIPAAAKVASAPPFPGVARFGPGRSNASVTQLGQQLVRKGYGRHYTRGPGPTWTEADRRNVQAFQFAQGWRGSAADGIPGPHTWALLFN
jgi:murein L,D-transpeptidase YcbB/YkuD